MQYRRIRSADFLADRVEKKAIAEQEFLVSKVIDVGKESAPTAKQIREENARKSREISNLISQNCGRISHVITKQDTEQMYINGNRQN